MSNIFVSRIFRLAAKVPLGWFFLIPVIIGVYVLPLLQKGMFVDGQHYAIIANNWARGIGDTWHLYFLDMQKFEGHPPLFFVLEGSLFWLFGDYFWVEGLFMLLVLTGHIWLFFALLSTLSRLTRNADIWDFRFAIVLLYLLSGGIPGFMVNNYLDCLQSLFTFFATYACLRALLESAYRKWLWYTLMGLAICLGYMTKGPVALFPLVQPLIWGQIVRQRKKALIYSAFVTLIAAMPILLLMWLNPAAREFMQTYHRIQVFPALMGSIDSNFPQPSGRHVNTNGYLQRVLVWLKSLFIQQLLPLILLAFSFLRYKLRRPQTLFVFGDVVYKKTLLFLLFAALAASLPIMLNPSILHNYLMPAHTLYILLFSLLILPFVRAWQIPKPTRWRALSLIATLILLVICVDRYGKASRYPELIALAEQVAKIVPPHSRVYYEDAQLPQLNPRYSNANLWGYEASFQRYSHSTLHHDFPTDFPADNFAATSYLLLHSSYLETHSKLIASCKLLANLAHGFQLYAIPKHSRPSP